MGRRESPKPDGPRQPEEVGRAVPAGRNTNAELDAVVEDFERLGYPHTVVVKALKATTMIPGLAGMVMQSLVDGKGVPSDEPGVWTVTDDLGLQGVQKVHRDENVPDDVRREAKKELKRLAKKHGIGDVELRKRYLEGVEKLGVKIGSHA